MLHFESGVTHVELMMLLLKPHWYYLEWPKPSGLGAINRTSGSQTKVVAHEVSFNKYAGLVAHVGVSIYSCRPC